MPVKIKRIYEPVAETDGYRVLIDRLWPRGIKKEGAHIDKWLKDIAPTSALRKWFNHEPEKWQLFIIKYHAEINGSPAMEELHKDQQHNNALALLQIINGHSG
jgi:uncharacterized protein YeaO (DUF488 family)